MQSSSKEDGCRSKKPCLLDVRQRICEKFDEKFGDIRQKLPVWPSFCPSSSNSSQPSTPGLPQTPPVLPEFGFDNEKEPLLGYQTSEVSNGGLGNGGYGMNDGGYGRMGMGMSLGNAAQFAYQKPNPFMQMGQVNRSVMMNGGPNWNTNGQGHMNGNGGYGAVSPRMGNGFVGMGGMNGVNGNSMNGIDNNAMNGFNGSAMQGVIGNGTNGLNTHLIQPNGSSMMMNGGGNMNNGNGNTTNGDGSNQSGLWSFLQRAPQAMNQLSINRSPSGTPVPMPPPRAITLTPGPPVPRLKQESSTNSNGSVDSAVTGECRKRVIEEIDLTNDDDDDIVVISQTTKAKPIAKPVGRPIYVPSPTPGPGLNINENTVCCGMIVDCFVNAHTVPSPRSGMDTFGEYWPLTPFALVRQPGPVEGNFTLKAIDYMRKEFGVLDLKTARALVRLVDCRIIRLQPRLLPRKKHGEKVGDMISSEEHRQLKLYINVYAYEQSIKVVGDQLRQHGIRLHPPKMPDEGIPFKNPHQDDILASQAVQSPEQFESALNNVMLDIQGKSETLEEMEQDWRVKTPLLKHQKQGLRFMTDREAPVFFNYNRPNCPWTCVRNAQGQIVKFIHKETDLEQEEEPLPVTGGILADVMGLGKTLSILSLIASTLDDARQYAGQALLTEGETARIQPVVTTGATLLVTPMSTITNWEEQIKAHLAEGTVSYYIYHGSKRELDCRALSQYDIIITTYSILGSEVNKARKNYQKESYVCQTPLLQLQFYRVVLDEAHTIREQRTQQFEGAYHVKAIRRWAVTGTPVQNGLKDLQALVRFLHISPYQIPRNFQSYILTPFRNADPCGLARIRKLVNTITLRRGKDKIDLPPRNDKMVYLDFSTEEKELYDKIFQQSRTQVEITYRAAVQKKKLKSLGGSNYANFLQAIMKLRLVCAHGKDLLCETDMAGLSSNHAIDVDELEEKGSSLTPKQAYSMFRLMCDASSDYCASCMQKPPRPEVDACEKTFAFMTDCFHVLCLKCVKDFEASVERTMTATGRYTCPLCEVHISKNFFALKINDVEEALKQHQLETKEKKRSAYTGPSSKVKALLVDMQADRAAYEANPDVPLAKSVVFSTWTTHLDLIGTALDAHNFPYVRLDGSMSLKLRQAAINSFREDPTIQVMLISIMAGGLGLNLTCASKAYVMEPMFNPACEAQAIDRVHRLGQKKDVTTVRYIMRDSFEEKILLLQKKKMEIANMSMGKIDKAELTRKKLSDIAEIFKIRPFP